MDHPRAVASRSRASLARALSSVLLGGGLLLAAEPVFVQAAPADLDLEVTATAAGFRPKVLRLRKGESARLVLRSADREHCFAVDELRVEKRILPGRETVAELTPDRVGTFTFYSCLEPDNEALRGRLIVSD